MKVSDNITKTEDTQATEAEINAKVYRLTEELLTTKKLKKSSNQAFNDEIKRLNAEIKELIENPDKFNQNLIKGAE